MDKEEFIEGKQLNVSECQVIQVKPGDSVVVYHDYMEQDHFDIVREFFKARGVTDILVLPTEARIEVYTS